MAGSTAQSRIGWRQSSFVWRTGAADALPRSLPGGAVADFLSAQEKAFSSLAALAGSVLGLLPVQNPAAADMLRLYATMGIQRECSGLSASYMTTREAVVASPPPGDGSAPQ